MTVSVFGGSAPGPGTPLYAQGVRLGALLAACGWTVATGGYEGTMEAVSRGAAEAGGRVLGVTTETFDVAGFRCNPWVSEEIRLESLRERVFHLVRHCEAAVALPGGVGTLSEVALGWSLLQAEEIPPKPLVLVGDFWRSALDSFLKNAAGLIRPRDIELLTFSPTAEAAVDHLKRRLAAAA